MNDIPHTLKIATVWLLTGVLVFLGFKAVEHQQQQTRFEANGDLIEIRRAPDGHYHWPGTINGRAVDFLIDTGATSTAMSQKMAQQLELESLGTVLSNTAGGVVTGTVVRADLALQGGVQAQRMRVTALAALDDSHPLLGMDVLGKLRWQQRDGVLTIDLRSNL
jgi:aspartyl protease family protein